MKRRAFRWPAEKDYCGTAFFFSTVAAMQSRTQFIVERLQTLTVLTEDVLWKIIGVLARADRFIHRKRRDLLASDLASMWNALAMGRIAGALESDDALAGLVYKGTIPAGRAPVFAHRTWRELLPFLITNAPGLAEPPGAPAADKVMPGTLPNVIEVSITMPAVHLVWVGSDGRPIQVDTFGPEKAATNGGSFARKTVIDGKVINLLADILRTPVVNAGAKVMKAKRETAATPAREAAAPLSRSRDVTPPPPSSHKGGTTDLSVVSQGPATRAPGNFRRKSRRSSDDRPHSST